MNVPKDPAVGWYEYRGARFHIERNASWGYFTYYVPSIVLPWMRGGLSALTHEAGWFAWTPRALLRKVKRAVDRAFRAQERNGKSTEPYAEFDAYNRDAPERYRMDRIADPERDYTVIA